MRFPNPLGPRPQPMMIVLSTCLHATVSLGHAPKTRHWSAAPPARKPESRFTPPFGNRRWANDAPTFV